MENRSLEQQYKTLVVLWGAMILSQMILVAVVFLTKPDVFSESSETSIFGRYPLPILALSAVGVSMLGLSFLFAQHFKKMSVSGQNPQMVQTALVIGCAMCEACSIIGIVLAFAFNFKYFYFLVLLGILTTMLHFPRMAELEATSIKTIKG
jgi:F0F1-type ATP synthase membrane subunit c/vacuolar-type H+-ATPase subunit K